MPLTYPIDRTTHMNEDGPSDHRFRVQGGTLLYNPKRDARFPYLYCVPSHALHSPQYIKKILLNIVDTSREARIEHAKFD
jgi:hypothetical protein